MEVIGGRKVNLSTAAYSQSKYFQKLGIGNNFRVLDERPAKQLDLIIKKCKEGRLAPFTELVEAAAPDGCWEDGYEENIANQGDAEGWTCYHYAAFQGYPSIITYLNSKGFNPNRESKDGWTPLQLACYQGKMDCAKELMKHPSIQINRVTWRGSALHQACQKGHEGLVQVLLDRKACMTQEDGQGRIPLQVASKLSIIEMIPRYMGKHQLEKLYTNAVKLLDEDKVPPPFCGEVFYSAPLTINDKFMYLVLDTGTGELLLYQSQRSFTSDQPPVSVCSLLDVQTVTKTTRDILSKRRYGFVVEVKNSKARYFCTYKEIADEWVLRLRQTVDFSQTHKSLLRSRLSSFAFRTLSLADTLENNKFVAVLNSSGSGSGVAEDEVVSVSGSEATLPELVSFSSFHIIEEIGSGSFGKVYKVKKLSDERIYAMKSLNKRYLARNKQLKYAISECRILKTIQHPFIIRLHHAFQTPRSLYMVLEYCPNGDLAAHLTEKGLFEEKEARFYLAETLLAIEFLHSQDIVYRDLKPENILLDRSGHIRLADFGLAKEGVNSSSMAKTFCGSPAYFAPEVLAYTGAGKPADIYGLGAILYEMLTGSSPYYSEDVSKMMANIQRQEKLNFPRYLSKEAKEVLHAVLDKDAHKRPTASALRSHAFFKGINWDLLLQFKVTPPLLGAGWVQVGEEETKDEDVYPIGKVDKDYSEQISLEECLLDFD